MHGIFLQSPRAGSPVPREAITAATAGLFERMDRSWKWARNRVRDVVHRMPGDEPAVPLEAYLEQVRARGESRADLVLSLARAIAAPSDDQ